MIEDGRIQDAKTIVALLPAGKTKSGFTMRGESGCARFFHESEKAFSDSNSRLLFFLFPLRDFPFQSPVGFCQLRRELPHAFRKARVRRTQSLLGRLTFGYINDGRLKSRTIHPIHYRHEFLKPDLRTVPAHSTRLVGAGI